MVHPNIKFWRAVGTMVGGIVGVGVFGLPYAFAQSGFLLGLLMLLFLAGLLSLLMLMYGEIASAAQDHHRLIGHLRRLLGAGWGQVALVLLAAALWGTMLAYLIVGGRFLHLLAAPFLGGSEAFYTLSIGILAAALIYRGLAFLARLEIVMVGILFFLFAFLTLASWPQIDFANLSTIHLENWFLPYGVILFAYGGLGAAPAMKEILGAKQSWRLGTAISLGMLIVGFLYLAFSFAVVGVTGAITTPVAFEGLINHLGPAFGIPAALLGTLTIISIFSVIGTELLNTFKFDFHLPHRLAWFLVIGVPAALYLFGLRTFIDLVGFIGSVFSAGLGILIVVAYEKLKKTASRSLGLRVPSAVSYLLIVVFVLGVLLEFRSLLA